MTAALVIPTTPTSPLRGGRNAEGVSGGGSVILHAALEASLAVDVATSEDLRAKARRHYARASREPCPRIRAAFVTLANDLAERATAMERNAQ